MPLLTKGRIAALFSHLVKFPTIGDLDKERVPDSANAGLVLDGQSCFLIVQYSTYHVARRTSQNCGLHLQQQAQGFDDEQRCCLSMKTI
jgi:hypothetical protein